MTQGSVRMAARMAQGTFAQPMTTAEFAQTALPVRMTLMENIHVCG